MRVYSSILKSYLRCRTMIHVKEVIIVLALFSSSFGNPIEQNDEHSVDVRSVMNRIDTLEANLSYIQRAQNDMLEQFDAIKKILEHIPDVTFDIKKQANKENGKHRATNAGSYHLKRYIRQVEPEQVAFTAKLNQKVENIPIRTKVLFDDLVYGTDLSYEPSTGVFTCPTSGLYLFSVFVESATHNGAFVSIMKDGVAIIDAVSEPSVTGEDDSGGNLVLTSVTKGSRVSTYQNENQSFWPSFTTFSGVLIHRFRD